MTAVTTWYTYPAQPLSPLIYLLWDSFVSVAKHKEFLLNYKISCSDTITCTSHMGLGTKHDSYNYWYSTKQCIKKKKTAIASANFQDGAQLDVAADGFWGSRFERAFFDVKVFYLYAPSPQLSACYCTHEASKKRAYERRILEVEHAPPSPHSSSLPLEA